MFFIGHDKSIQLLARKPRSKWFALVCIGRKRHYRKDGSCVHTAEVIAGVREDARYRVKVDPFGGKQRAKDVA